MNKFSNKKGFTLIELLIVIAVLGTLAVVVLVALNPVQQLARTRDSGRLSSVTQLGRIVQAYATTYAAYPTADADWMQTLVDAGELDGLIAQVQDQLTAYSACGNNEVNGYCYDTAGDDFVVFASAEAAANFGQCPNTTDHAWFAYLSTTGRAGLICTADAATRPTANMTATNFVN